MLNMDRAFGAPDDEVIHPEPYCQLCEREGHTVRSCPTRDDDPGYGD